jgi:cellulose biosynthesis protein BcsQ
MDDLALDGMTQTLDSVKALKEFPAITQPTLLGVLPTNFSEARKGDLQMYHEVANTLKAKQLILPCIRTDTKAVSAIHNHMTIWEFAPRAKSAIGSEKPIGLEGANSLGLHGGYLHLCEIVDALIPQIERRTKYARN